MAQHRRRVQATRVPLHGSVFQRFLLFRHSPCVPIMETGRLSTAPPFSKRSTSVKKLSRARASTASSAADTFCLMTFLLKIRARSAHSSYTSTILCLHIPVVPRDQYKGKSGNGDWADCLLQLDGDFGELLDKIDALGLKENTIVVFAGDNGNEELLLNRGPGGFWEGSRSGVFVSFQCHTWLRAAVRL